MATAQEAYEEALAVYQKRPHHEVGSFYWDKARRTEHYLRFEFGHKLQKCGACNGSGRYDHNGSPRCGCCEGTKTESVKGEKAWSAPVRPDFKHVLDTKN